MDSRSTINSLVLLLVASMVRPQSLLAEDPPKVVDDSALAALARYQDLTDQDSKRWKLINVDMTITIEPGDGRLVGEGVARLLLEGAPSLGPTLELGKALRFRQSAAPEGLRSVVTDDRRLVRYRFAKPAEAGTTLDLPIQWENEGRDFQFVVDAQAALASWVSAWYPSPLGGSEAATGNTTMIVPAAWQTVSSGKLLSTEIKGAKRHDHWQIKQPVSRSFAAAAFEVQHRRVGEAEIGIYLFHHNRHRAGDYAAALEQALQAQEAKFGPYPYPNYSIVEVPTSLVEWGGSSEQGFYMATSNTFEVEGVNLPLITHELAHGWWGNLVHTEQPGSLMVGEALAQYSAVIAIEAIEGEQAATEFLRFSRPGYNPLQCARGYFALIFMGQDKPLMELTGTGQDHNLSDAKGHWVYHMLRRRVGDELFFKVLRSLIDRFAGQNMSLADVRTAFLDAAPAEAGLERFFAQWLDQAGAPVLGASFETADPSSNDGGSDGGSVELLVRQLQAADPYELRLDVEVDVDGRTTRHTIELRERSTRAVLNVRGTPSAVRLDPDNRILRWMQEYGPKPSLLSNSEE